MFVYPLPSILSHFQPILIENLSNPIRIKSKSIYFPCLGSLAGVMFPVLSTRNLVRKGSPRNQARKGSLRKPGLDSLKQITDALEACSDACRV